MTTVQNVYDYIKSLAPEYMAESWDHVGLLCGRADREVKRVLVALDPFHAACEEAKTLGCQLLLTHHPIIWKPDAVNDATETGRNLLYLIENGISAVNAHTNLDHAPEGVNDCLAKKLGLTEIEVIDPAGTDAQGRPYGLIRVGNASKQPLAEFCAHVSERLQCHGLRVADGGKPVSRVAVGGGSCASEMEKVLAAGCDTFVTADVKYHEFLQAAEKGLNLIDAGHFGTENPVCDVIERVLRESFPELTVLRSQSHKDPTQFA